jgi:hypothetical protein
MTSHNSFLTQTNGRIAHVFVVFLFGLLALGLMQGQSGRPKLPSGHDYGDLPLAFEPNQGQTSGPVDFLSHIDGSLALFDRSGVSLWFAPEQQALRSPLTGIHIHLLRASPAAEPKPDDLQPGHSNYFVGTDRSRWRTNIPNYGLVTFSGIYPGIDLVYYGNHRRLEHDFHVAPMANPEVIEFAFEGVSNIELDSNGSLRLKAASRELLLKRPVAYQEKAGHREFVNAAYEVHGNCVRFRLGRYDIRRELIIDPVLAYSTYVSGSNGSLGELVAVDASGSAYIAGFTGVSDFPTVNPYQASPKGNGDIFVTKVNASGTALVYSTYLGGSLYDQPSGIAVDSQGNAIVVGHTQSDDFPTLPATTGSGGNHTHGFITSLSPAGNTLNWSQYTGGSSDNSVNGVALDANDNLYVTGGTDSPDFPVTAGTIVHSVAPSYPNNDIFVQKLSNTGTIQYSAVVGHLPLQSSQAYVSLVPSGIAVDASGNVVVAGSGTGGLPTTSGAFQPNPTNVQPGSGGSYNGFILKLNATASQLLFATYFSGNQGAPISAVALDPQADVYVTGSSYSTDLFQTNAAAGTSQAFVAKLDSTGSHLLYATYIQGVQANVGYSSAAGITVDRSGDAFVVGTTSSTTFPMVNPLLSFLGTGLSGPASAAFVTELNPPGTGFLFSSFLSGSTGANGNGIALDQSGNAYVVGTSFSIDYPTTSGAYQTAIPNPPPYTQPNAPFLTKLNLSLPAPSMCFSRRPVLQFGTVKIGTSRSITNVITNCGNSALAVSGVTTNPPFAQTNTCTGSIAPGATCSVTLSFSPGQVATYTGSLMLSTNAALVTQGLQLAGSGDYSHLTVPTSITFDNQVVRQGSSTAYAFLQVTGSFPVTISSVSTSGDFSADNGCTGTIYQSCSIKLTFAPTISGVRTGTLVINDDAQGGPHTVNLSGTAYDAYPVPVTSTVSKSAVRAGSPDTTIWVYGDLFFSLSTVNWNGSPRPTQFVNQHELSVTLSASDLSDWKESQLSVSNPTPGGGTSNSQRVVVYAGLSLNANQVIFEPYSRQLYVSVSSSNPTYANQVLQIDPATASIKRSISLGTNPTYLALSDDGRYLYVAVDNNVHVAQYDLLQQSTVRTFGIGNDLSGSYTVMDLKVAPGAPNTIAVSQRASSGGPNAGVAVLDSGVKRPDYLTYTDYTSAESISFVKDAFTLFGSSYSFTPPADDTVMNLDSAGVHITQRLSPPPFTGVIFSDGKYIYSSQDMVYAPLTNTVVGTYKTSSIYPLAILLPDSDSGRTFGATTDSTIWGLDQSSFQPTDSLNFSDYWLGLNSQVQNKFVRWASDGYAFIGRSMSGAPYDFVLFRSSFGNANPASSAATITGLNPSSTAAGTASNLAITVAGQNFVPGAVVTWNGQDCTTHFLGGTQLIADIPAPNLANVGSYSLAVRNPGTASSGATSFSVVLSDSAFVTQQYEDFLDRQPDPAGLNAWLGALSAGTSRSQMIADFMSSTEFSGKGLFVAQAYVGLLGRDADYNGFKAWLNWLENGSGTELGLVSAFLNSSEFQNNFGANLTDTQFVTLMYQNVLLRQPDSGGVSAWVSYLASGGTRPQVALGFLQSAEFLGLTSTQNRVTVSLLYFDMLRRQPDSGGFNGWVAALNSGTSLVDVISGFLNSGEYSARFQ